MTEIERLHAQSQSKRWPVFHRRLVEFFLLLRQLDPGGSLLSRPLAIPLPLFALILTGAGAGLYGALCFSRRAWRLADTPIARIRPAPQGYVELYGRARLLPGPPILAPLSSLPCAWYRYQIEERSSGGRWWLVESGDSDNLSLWTTALLNAWLNA